VIKFLIKIKDIKVVLLLLSFLWQLQVCQNQNTIFANFFESIFSRRPWRVSIEQIYLLIYPVPHETVIYLDTLLALLPWVFLTVREVVYLPFLVYVCTGLLDVEDVPSPKTHLHEVGDPVLLSVNCTLKGTFPEVGDAENAPTGVLEGVTTLIDPDLVIVLLPAAFLAVRLTVYFPALLYVWSRFCCVEVLPSPKTHLHEVGDPVLLSVKVTFNGTFPEVGVAEKAAAGGLKAFTAI
jgi:hypothetical protein